MSLARVTKRLFYVASAIIIFIALLIATARLFTPYLNDHLPDVDALAGRFLNAPVKISDVYISWHLYEPELVFDQVNIIDDKTHKPKLHIENAAVAFSIFDSIVKRQLMVKRVRISGVHLTLRQNPTGTVGVVGFSELQITDNLTGSTVQSNDIFNSIFSISRLVFKRIDIDFYSAAKQKYSFSLNRFVLNNSGASHSLSGQGQLNQAIPTRLNLQMNWNGDVNDLSKVSAKIYLYIEGIDLPQWSKKKTWKNQQILQGLGSLKIWANWDNNDWQRIQSRMQFYDVEIKSLSTKATQTISRLTGDLGWRRDGNKQIFAGAQIFLDLPEHLWPVTGFTVVMAPDQAGSLYPEKIQVAFLDIEDVKKLAFASGLLSEDIQKKIQTYNPAGQINNFQLHFPDANLNPITATIDAGFNGLSIAEVGQFPGVNNLSGIFSWNGTAGKLDLNSTQTVIQMDKVFGNTLIFDKLNGAINFEHTANDSWQIDLKNFFAINADIKTHTDMTVSIPKNDSPQINLSADYGVLNAGHIANYLPLKTFSADLVKWLREAFVSGQVDSGKIILQGKLSGFPFDNNTGKFSISANVKNIEFNYAPEWPLINKLNGALVFSGRAVTIDVTSGQIFNVQLSPIHAVIPYIGDAGPQILTVQSDPISTDLGELMHFVHASPLEKIIGNDLGAMTLHGATKLKLALSLPLSKPEDVKLQGDLDFSDAKLDLPLWKLNVEKLKGGLHFTESEIIAKQLEGELFGEKLTLDIATQHPADKTSYVQANFQSLMSVESLQKWLDIPLMSVAKGKTLINGTLNMYSHSQANQATTVKLHTDLKGVSLALPDQYGKDANGARNFDVEITTPKDELRTKMTYADLLTAALTFKLVNGGLHFASGELNLGGDATWQTQPGLLISGEFKTIDWDKIQSKFSGSEAKISNVSLLRSIDLNIEQFNIYGQQLHNARIQLSNVNNSWLINVNSQEVVGQVTVPTTNNPQAVQAKFQRLYLKSDNKSIAAINPKTLPTIAFSGSDVRYNDKSVGAVNLNLVPTQSGASFKELTISSSLGQLHAQGEWSGSAGKYTTHLQGNINTTRVSDFLKSWGYGTDNFICNNGTAHFDLTWSGAPYDPSIASMNGEFSLSLGPGRIVNLSDSNNAKMDFARLLNVLSLTSLPHLGEIFQKGYSFDYVKGDYSLKNGNAFTQNTKLDGSIARVTISGRIGFASKDFDIVLSVTPYVTESLPFVAAAVTAWNPITGVAAWMLNKMVVSKAVSNVATHTYTVRGPWSNPVWGQADSGKRNN